MSPDASDMASLTPLIERLITVFVTADRQREEKEWWVKEVGRNETITNRKDIFHSKWEIRNKEMEVVKKNFRFLVKFWNILQINKLPPITHAGPQRPYVLIPPFTSHSTLFIPISEDVHPPNGVPGNTRMNGEAPELRALVRTEREGRGKVKRD